MQITNKRIAANEKCVDINLQMTGELHIDVEAGATYACAFLQCGQRLKMRVTLLGKGASCDINIAYLSATGQDNTIECEVIHAHPETHSKQQIKGVLAGKGKTVFNGLIRIPKDSQKCEGHQNHRAILLSDDAKVSCTPELEIYADDVKCAHGSAIGALDEKQVFYLQTRGLDETEARKMLITVFLSDIMPDTFMESIQDWMVQHA